MWKLLSPTSGHEYKRQLISNMVGNFVYDQYMTTVFGGTMEYYSGGVQQTVTKSQTVSSDSRHWRTTSLQDGFIRTTQQ